MNPLSEANPQQKLNISISKNTVLMTSPEITLIRLENQKISNPEHSEAQQIVSWMGAMQAQDYPMSKWAIGLRLSDPSEQKIESAIDRGDILRIHVLRPTWHFISSDDIYWMLELSSPKIISSLRSRHKVLELSEDVLKKTRDIIVKKLSGGNSLTREELAAEFNKIKIRTDENRLSHILFCAELFGIVCSGPVKGKKLTYSLLHERVPVKRELNRNEALAELAKRYFSSRWPATIEDFIWWSNLSVKDAREAVHSIRTDFISDHSVSGNYILPASFSGRKINKDSVRLLPAYDEFLISYSDRSSSLSSVNNKKTVSNNGIFYPTIVINGQVEGLWKRTIIKDKVEIYPNFFRPVSDRFSKSIKKMADLYGKFLNKEALLRI